MRKCFLFSDLILKITWFYFICLKSCFSTLLTRPWSVSPSAVASRWNAGDRRRPCPPLTLASHPLPPATAVLFPFPVFVTGTLRHEHQRCLPFKGQQSAGGIPVSSNLLSTSFSLVTGHSPLKTQTSAPDYSEDCLSLEGKTVLSLILRVTNPSAVLISRKITDIQEPQLLNLSDLYPDKNRCKQSCIVNDAGFMLPVIFLPLKKQCVLEALDMWRVTPWWYLRPAAYPGWLSPQDPACNRIMQHLGFSNWAQLMNL